MLAACGALFLVGCGNNGTDPPPRGDVQAIADRVASIRGLAFERLPGVEVLPAETLADEIAASIDEDYPEKERASDETLLHLLGYLELSESIDDAYATLASNVAGSYEPRDGTIALADDIAAADRETRDITLAHELLHALEDQRFGITDEGAVLYDADLARAALWEGTAIVVEGRFDLLALGGVFPAVDPEEPSLEPRRPVGFTAVDNLLYVSGREFVAGLLEASNGDWRRVNRALREEPPLSTEHILDPRTYLAGDAPAEVTIPGTEVLLRGPSAGKWLRTDAGVFGRLDAALTAGAGDDRRPASLADIGAGWEGGTFELWRRADAKGDCAPPCAAQSVLVIKVQWDGTVAADAYARSIRDAARGRFAGTPAGRDVWRSRGGAVALDVRGDFTGVVFAPDAALATKLAAGILNR